MVGRKTGKRRKETTRAAGERESDLYAPVRDFLAECEAHTSWEKGVVAGIEMALGQRKLSFGRGE